jgi:hypothetical protein
LVAGLLAGLVWPNTATQLVNINPTAIRLDLCMADHLNAQPGGIADPGYPITTCEPAQYNQSILPGQLIPSLLRV